MKYLRHSQLTIWIVIVVVVAALAGAIVSEGRTHHYHGISPISVASSSDAGSIRVLQANMSTAETLLYSGGSLHTWALKEAGIAKHAADVRMGLAGPGPLVNAFRAVELSALRVSDLGPHASMRARVSAVSALGSQLDALVGAAGPR